MKKQKKPKIEIIAVGSELLTPYFQDTNSLYLTKRLNDLGLRVNFKSIVGDREDDLRCSFKKALVRSDLIFTIGGLGPTEDDRTREVLCSLLNLKLVFKKELLQTIEERFQKRRISMPSVNKKQAYLIQGAEVLVNEYGTAPGMWLNNNSKTIILLPGPPSEFKPVFEKSVWPRLKKYQRGYLSHRVLKITGLTESKIESLISDIHPQSSTVSLTTVACPGQVEIHVSGYSEENFSQAEIKTNEVQTSILNRLGKNVFSIYGEELEETVGKLLKEKGKTLAVAESCSGGLLSHRITNVSGSSRYFLEGVVAYSNKSKIQLLGVNPALIQNHGAVSAEVAGAMAKGIKEKSGADFGLSTTGIAGPTGGTPSKPVGLVYTALEGEEGTEVVKNIFLGGREKIKFQSTQKILDMLRRNLLKHK